MKAFGRHRVTAPDGTDWSVGRVWFGERKLKSREWRTKVTATLTDGDVSVLEAFDGLDVESWLVVVAATAAVVLIVLPLLLFGLELIIVGAVLAVGVVSRSLFGKPWTVAASRDGAAVPAALWRVKGSRASHRLIARVCAELRTCGQLPAELPDADFIERVS